MISAPSYLMLESEHETMAVSSRIVANEFIRLAAESGRTFTPLQLMKLVYIAHGWSLGLFGKPLVSEQVEAWRYGPVLPVLYGQVKSFGAGPVPSALPVGLFSGPNNELSDREKDLIKQTYELYGNLNGIQLSGLTHQAGTPWSITWERAGKNGQISQDLITEHYRQLSQERARS